MEIQIKNETEKDYREVEELTREAFWNLYVPGADEHFIVHNLRKSKNFIKHLDLVAVHQDKIVGSIIYTLSYIEDEFNQKHEVITFGPVSILPEFQNKGIGRKLIEYSIKKARDLSYKAIIIYGYPDYYSKYGFKSGKNYNICTPEGTYMKALQVLELQDNALKGIHGKFFQDNAFYYDESEKEKFDKTFSEKEKLITESQKKFEEMLNMFEWTGKKREYGDNMKKEHEGSFFQFK